MADQAAVDPLLMKADAVALDRKHTLVGDSSRASSVSHCGAATAAWWPRRTAGHRRKRSPMANHARFAFEKQCVARSGLAEGVTRRLGVDGTAEYADANPPPCTYVPHPCPPSPSTHHPAFRRRGGGPEPSSWYLAASQLSAVAQLNERLRGRCRLIAPDL